MDTKIQVSRKSETDATVGKARGDVFVLEDLIVHEVSSVDVPANKRRWLMIKNAQGTQGDTLMPDGKGGFVTKAASATTDTGTGTIADATTDTGTVTEPAEVVEAAKAEPPVDTAPEVAVEPEPEVSQSETVEAVKAETETVVEPVAETPVVETTQVVEAAKSEPEVSTPEVQEAAPLTEAAPAAETAKATPAPAPTSPDIVVEIDAATASILEGAAGVMKAGKKISAERKARLQQIADQLSEFLKEVEDQSADMYDAAKAMQEVREEMSQLQAQLKELAKTNNQLTLQVDELRATNKGTGTIAPVQTEKTAPPVSGQFAVTNAGASRPANVSWVGLQRELGQRKK